jgi:hypothetical protein
MGVTPKKTMAAQLLAIVALCVFAFLLNQAFGGVGTAITCFLAQLDAMAEIDPDTSVGAAIAGALNALPDRTQINQIASQIIPLLGLAVIIPAALVALFEIILLVCQAKATAKGAGCAKCLMCFLNLLTFIGIVLYLVIGAAGTVISNPAADSVRGAIDSVCVDQTAVMQSQINYADEQLESAQGTLDYT